MRNLSFKKSVNMHGFWYVYVLLIIIGKVVRWTIMKATLVNWSKGWGYPYHIINDPFSITLFGLDEVSEGVVGIGDNLYSIMKIFWYLCLTIPYDFKSFEVFITIIWGLMLFAVICRVNESIKMEEFIFLCLAVILLSVYCFALAKEPVQMLYFFLFFFALNAKRFSVRQRMVLAVSAILLSIATFRVYYILILFFGAAFYFMINMLTKDEINDLISAKKVLGLFAYMCAVYLIIMLGLLLINYGLFARMRDSLLWASDATSSSNTYMNNVIIKTNTSNALLISAEYLLAVLRMAFPIELIRLGPKYWLYVLYQILMSVMLINAVRTYKNNPPLRQLATIVMVGFLFASATFEVDFGAWVRHNCVTLPAVLVMNGMIQVDERYNE